MQFVPENDLFRISVYRNNAPAYMKPPVEYYISELLSPPVSIAGYDRNTGVTLYPNPVRDKLFIEPEYLNKNLNFTVFSPDGSVKLSGKLSKEKPTLQVNFLLPGIYFIKVGNKAIVKFVKL
jgi:hypothetical protein